MRRTACSGQDVSRCSRICVFISTTRAAILMRRKRSGVNWAQTKIADTIVARGGDYLLALKANRPATHVDVVCFFADPLKDVDPARLRDNRQRPRLPRKASPPHLPRRRLAVPRPPLSRRAALSASGHDRHGRTDRRARRQDTARATLLPVLRQARCQDLRRRRRLLPLGASRTGCTGCLTSSSNDDH